jgi:hypothetical protein
VRLKHNMMGNDIIALPRDCSLQAYITREVCQQGGRTGHSSAHVRRCEALTALSQYLTHDVLAVFALQVVSIEALIAFCTPLQFEERPGRQSTTPREQHTGYVRPCCPFTTI